MSQPTLPALRSFVRFSWHYKTHLALPFIAFLLSNIVIYTVPYFIGQLVEAGSRQPFDANGVMVYAWILVACSSLHDILWRAGELLFRRYITPISFDYETALFRHVITKPYAYFVDKFTGKISANIATLRDALRDFLVEFNFHYTGQIVGLIMIGSVLATVNWQTLAIFIAGIAGMIGVGRYTVRGSSKYEAIATDVNSTKGGLIIDSIANFASVKSFHKEWSEIAAIERMQEKALRSTRTAALWGIVFWGSMSFFIRHLIWPAAILLNVSLFVNGQLSIGQLATLLSTVLLFSNVVWDMIWDASQFVLRRARAEEAYTYLFGAAQFDHGAVPPKAASTLSFTKTLELRGLSFAYPDKLDTLVLRDLNVTIRHGEKIGIVGKSGSGKTTLIKALLDYYPLPDQTIIVDGQPTDTKQLARAIANVPQDTSLFHRSIADNIAYAVDRTVSRDEIIAAAKKAHAHEFIMGIQDGYDAMVGERGVKLSGGQRQRIAIARAILKNAPILILDEATSALDSESEKLIQDALDEVMAGRTSIVIAHRLSTIQRMDRIIVLDHGRIVEQGTHTELLKNNNIYATLWAHQSGGFIKE